jgi:hypothetical protein
LVLQVIQNFHLLLLLLFANLACPAKPSLMARLISNYSFFLFSTPSYLASQHSELVDLIFKEESQLLVAEVLRIHLRFV